MVRVVDEAAGNRRYIAMSEITENHKVLAITVTRLGCDRGDAYSLTIRWLWAHILKFITGPFARLGVIGHHLGRQSRQGFHALCRCRVGAEKLQPAAIRELGHFFP